MFDVKVSSFSPFSLYIVLRTPSNRITYTTPPRRHNESLALPLSFAQRAYIPPVQIATEKSVLMNPIRIRKGCKL
jgi:hypothetical protein